MFDLDFNYRSVVGKLNYLAQTTRPDIMYATHQIAKYSSDPRQSHGEAILYLIGYLKKTCDFGPRFKPDSSKGFECYCDADFSGLLNKAFEPVDPTTSKSQSGWIIFYAGCPVSWASKLQSQVAMSTTEAEYIACHKLYMTSFLSWDNYRSGGSKISRFFVLSSTCIARSLKTTQAPQTGMASQALP
jgi:hypothetical protein